MQGFTQGFYNNPKFVLNKNCLDKTFSEDIRVLYDSSNGFQEPNPLQIMSVVYQIFYGFDKYCNVKDIIYDIAEWCLTGQLSFEMIGQNLLSKVFVITGSVNSLVAEVFESQAGDITDLKGQF